MNRSNMLGPICVGVLVEVFVVALFWTLLSPILGVLGGFFGGIATTAAITWFTYSKMIQDAIAEKKGIDPKDWHAWFAWYPVYTKETGMVWLRFINRRDQGWSAYYATEMGWEYSRGKPLHSEFGQHALRFNKGSCSLCESEKLFNKVCPESGYLKCVGCGADLTEVEE